MKPENGTDYGQNYDVIVKWLADALRGETLEAIGVPTGRIEEVFAFDVADISVTAGRVDIMVRDHFGDLYHIEEERNLRKSDLYRFAAYHFAVGNRDHRYCACFGRCLSWRKVDSDQQRKIHAHRHRLQYPGRPEAIGRNSPGSGGGHFFQLAGAGVSPAVRKGKRRRPRRNRRGGHSI